METSSLTTERRSKTWQFLLMLTILTSNHSTNQKVTKTEVKKGSHGRNQTA